MAGNYSATSPYAQTPIEGGEYLDIMVNRSIPKYSDDARFTINETYHLRPDLLAYDLYGTSSLWWVFAQRNPNSLADPLMSFKAGTSIYLPKKDTLKEVLGF